MVDDIYKYVSCFLLRGRNHILNGIIDSTNKQIRYHNKPLVYSFGVINTMKASGRLRKKEVWGFVSYTIKGKCTFKYKPYDQAYRLIKIVDLLYMRRLAAKYI